VPFGFKEVDFASKLEAAIDLFAPEPEGIVRGQAECVLYASSATLPCLVMAQLPMEALNCESHKLDRRSVHTKNGRHNERFAFRIELVLPTEVCSWAEAADPQGLQQGSSGRVLQADFAELAVSGLASMYPAQGKRVMPLTIMTIADLENLESSIVEFSMRQLLADYADAHPEGLVSLHNFMVYDERYADKLKSSAQLIADSERLIRLAQRELFPHSPDLETEGQVPAA
jgi:hypothetical protein